MTLTRVTRWHDTPWACTGVCALCFSSSTTHKHGATVAQFKVAFEHDLKPGSPGFPGSLGELAARLKLWRARLAATLDQSMPSQLQLEHEARNLQVRAPCSDGPGLVCASRVLARAVAGGGAQQPCTLQLNQATRAGVQLCGGGDAGAVPARRGAQRRGGRPPGARRL